MGSVDDSVETVTEYLKLGLRFGRVVDGFVDAYTGDPALRRQVDDEPAPDPADLSRQAATLCAAVPDAGLSPARSDYLTAHLDALTAAGRRLAGEPMSFIDEARSYFQVDIDLVHTDVYAAAHDEISALIGGSGPLADRLAAVRAAETCPPELVETVVRTVARALRERTAGPTGIFDLPEHIDFEIARDVAWSGFNYYLGGFRSRVAVNADIGHRMSQFGVLVAHECYPGHHTEHCRKEDLLVNRGGEHEHQIFLVNTPQCLMAEGLADLALYVAVGRGWGEWAGEIYADLGLGFDGDRAQAVSEAAATLADVRQDAALMLHDEHRDVDDVVEFLKRWLLVNDQRARQMLRFLSSPLWRAYTSTYVEGYRLLRGWLEARPDEVSLTERFARLLDEPLIPSSLRAA